ncbi:G-type lectin S-receptor-like serine/threonine-protein kinase SD2-5 [Capsicum baccatum]|uniref:G-type lectin S-receptor-like serine/threonine-protein kinase SD2-5 n=1 Tax=Capsicum baccatum TaxID=33114 RepID=A0A2G2VRT3_CAPBA|nr:G-type lectin S-receptor-like serine/threonine-protein kinase SD2-5 [Capsicum baccatum]
MPTRFSYDDLNIAKENFTKKLGEGGFESIFEGCLEDDTKIAVKYLDEIGKVKKSFLAKVETIGSIHHVNLVQLIGFCVEKSHRILVYEFMSNGSLEKWIYHEKQEQILDWNCRKKIIQDVAKETEEERIMLNLFRKKTEKEQLVGLIDKHSEDIQFYKEEVIKTMKIVAWCLQSDYTKRPSMSMVVKAMKGVLDVEKDLDYNFKPQTIPAIPNISFADSTHLLPSVLSGSR